MCDDLDRTQRWDNRPADPLNYRRKEAESRQTAYFRIAQSNHRFISHFSLIAETPVFF